MSRADEEQLVLDKIANSGKTTFKRRMDRTEIVFLPLKTKIFARWDMHFPGIWGTVNNFIFSFETEDGKQSKSNGGKGNSNSKFRNRKKYNSSDEESEEAPKVSRKKNSGSTSKSK